MKPEIKKLWLEALRSGEYKQTKGKLRDDNGYCCLGVLCDLYKKETGKGEWKESNNIYDFEIPDNTDLIHSGYLLPYPV